MGIINELNSYIKQKEINGALMISGQWGCGKTYLVKEFAKSANSGKDYAIIIVSLFGIDSLQTLNQRIKEQVQYIKKGVDNNDNKNRHKTKVKSVAKTITSTLGDFHPAFKGIHALLSINVYDLIEVTRTLECKCEEEIVEKELVIIFDDFERCKVDAIDLLGAINEYTENKNIKTIIVANEEKLNIKSKRLTQYNVFKEKLISRTIRTSSDYSKIIESIIDHFPETTKGYQSFIKENFNLIKEVFLESKSENIRTIKSVLIDFERIYSVWGRTGVSGQYLPSVLYVFSAISFETKSGQYKKGDFGYLFAESTLKEKYSLYISAEYNDLFARWLAEGFWSADEFIELVKSRYIIKELEDDERFLRDDFWNLQQENIDKGLPIALQKAYDGLLSCNDLILLLQRLHDLKELKIKIACDADYGKLSQGFEEHKKLIKQGTIIEPKRHYMFEISQIEPEAKFLYQEIERLDYKIYAWENEELLVSYLKGRNDVSYLDFQNKNIESFNETLRDLFIEKYVQSNNSKKKEMSLILLGLNFISKQCSDSNNIQITLTQIGIVKSTILGLMKSEEDSITKLIQKSFLDKLNPLIEKIRKATVSMAD